MPPLFGAIRSSSLTIWNWHFRSSVRCSGVFFNSALHGCMATFLQITGPASHASSVTGRLSAVSALAAHLVTGRTVAVSPIGNAPLVRGDPLLELDDLEADLTTVCPLFRGLL